MVTLKGPIRIGGKDSNIVEKLKEAGVEVKTPFGNRLLDTTIVEPITHIKEKKLYTADILKKMNKKQHIEILNKLGVAKIPLLESSRVELILKLQG